MKQPFPLLIIALLFQSVVVSGCAATSHQQPALLTRVKPLPTALDSDFEFRKAKLFLMTETAPQVKQKESRNVNKAARNFFIQVAPPPPRPRPSPSNGSIDCSAR